MTNWQPLVTPPKMSEKLLPTDPFETEVADFFEKMRHELLKHLPADRFASEERRQLVAGILVAIYCLSCGSFYLGLKAGVKLQRKSDNKLWIVRSGRLYYGPYGSPEEALRECGQLRTEAGAHLVAVMRSELDKW